jgi:predicted phosphodiesterase
MNTVFPQDATPGRARQLLDEMEADVLILGHTHVPMRIDLDRRAIV